jgi:hypothetical protein
VGARQTGCTELMLMAAALAVVAADQCVVSPDGSVLVRVATRSITVWWSSRLRGGHVLSRRRPLSRPACIAAVSGRQQTRSCWSGT